MSSLAILIPTLIERRTMFNTLRAHLEMQIGDRDVKVISDVTPKAMTIGAKRQKMLQECTADYVVFIDDDDMVTDDYVDRIYTAIQSSPDVVGLRGYMTTNRQNSENWCISIKYDWADNQDGYRYVRYPNHLAPIKREHALAAGFPDIRHGEDYEYSMRLKRSGLLVKEEFIDAELYHYIFIVRK